MDANEKASQVEFLRHAVEHLEDKAKSDLKIALYGSSFFLVLSLLHVGDLKYASLVVSAIDIWYFMSWGNDQLRLAHHRSHLRELEGQEGVESRSERHPNHAYERVLYYLTPLIILEFFVVGLILDYEALRDAWWGVWYFGVVAIGFATTLTCFWLGSKNN
jgi:hypothetical protein